MPDKRPNKEFGKRRPEPLQLPPKEPIKRSGHVALLVMGTIAVGSTAYALMPHSNCDPPAPGTAAPAQPNTGCTGRSWSGGSGSTYHHYGFFSSGSSDSSSRSSSGSSSESGSSSVTRGGFGSFAHAFGFSGHG